MSDGRSRQRGVLATIGVVVAWLMAIAGLVVVAFFILMAIALNNYGSNK